MLILEQFNKLILQQFRFVPSNLDGAKKTMFFIIEEAKKNTGKQHRKNIDNPSIRICVNKIENTVTFKIKIGCCLELLTPEIMKYL